MVGVAISASLLPPAVNTGLYWAMALMSYGFQDSLLQTNVTTTEQAKVNKITIVITIRTFIFFNPVDLTI